MHRLTRNLEWSAQWLTKRKKKALFALGYVCCARCGREISADMAVSLPLAPKEPLARATILGEYPRLRTVYCSQATCGSRNLHGRLRVQQSSYGPRIAIQVTDSDLIWEMKGERLASIFIDLTPPQSS